MADEPEKCLACDEPMKAGQLYYPDDSGDSIHADCAGTDPEGFIDYDTGEHLKPGDPLPRPSVWRDDEVSA